MSPTFQNKINCYALVFLIIFIKHLVYIYIYILDALTRFCCIPIHELQRFLDVIK